MRPRHSDMPDAKLRLGRVALCDNLHTAGRVRSSIRLDGKPGMLTFPRTEPELDKLHSFVRCNVSREYHRCGRRQITPLIHLLHVVTRDAPHGFAAPAHWCRIPCSFRVEEPRERLIRKTARLVEQLHPLRESLRLQPFYVLVTKCRRYECFREYFECLIEIRSQHCHAQDGAVPIRPSL